jgi:hypothetical protein
MFRRTFGVPPTHYLVDQPAQPLTATP